MTANILDYPALIDYAMRGVVREALRQIEKSGLPGDHHFFISYRTDHPGVQMSDTLRSRYPEDITVVIQHQFWDLKVEEDKFSVTLSFSNVPEKLVVPFMALTAFADPSIKFGLQFHGRQKLPVAEELRSVAAVQPKTAQATYLDEVEDSIDLAARTSGAEIITLDAFRKK